jgi:hypothetical protein
MAYYLYRKLRACLFMASLIMVTASCNQQSSSVEITSSGGEGAGPLHKHHKLGANVVLSSSPIVFSEANHKVQSRIILTSNVNYELLKIDVLPSRGLHLLNETHWEFSANNHEPIEIPVELLAESDGRYYVNLHIESRSDENRSNENKSGESNKFQSLVVIVQVGPEQPKAREKYQSNSSQGVVILPAQEVVY